LDGGAEQAGGSPPLYTRFGGSRAGICPDDLGNGIRGLKFQKGKRSVPASVGLARHEHRRPSGTSTGLVCKGVQDEVNGAVGSDNTQDHDRNHCQCEDENY
jgi:hypothetical protein